MRGSEVVVFADIFVIFVVLPQIQFGSAVYVRMETLIFQILAVIEIGVEDYRVFALVQYLDDFVQTFVMKCLTGSLDYSEDEEIRDALPVHESEHKRSHEKAEETHGELLVLYEESNNAEQYGEDYHDLSVMRADIHGAHL